MGQTLTHGIYLPDEGERNCYNGLAANWQLLDGAVGTIAEHTTALSGKAPAVHTHTVSDITDFPAYGNAAGTICEGNDSRLSDARTPVAHTHTKSDVTDLLNSNFIPSANNSYDLGSSSYQWNNVYGKAYYYNGTEFQNKFVTLDSDQTLTGRKNYKTSYSDILPKTVNFPSATRYYVAQRDYAYNDEPLTLTWGFVQSSGTNVRRWYVYPYSSGDSVYFQININADASSSEFKTNVKSVIPVTNNTTDLGTSTSKWKSLNGLNPGALSLPTGNDSESIAVDITDWYIQDPDYPDDPTKKILDATNHKVDTAVPGWLQINFPNVAGNWAYARKYAAGANMSLQRIADGIADSDFAIITLIFPIYSSCYVRIKAKTATVRIFPCLGNV